MADPITWGLINLVKKGIKGVQTTLDGVKNSVDTLPEDVQTKLDAFEVTIDELKKNVEDSLADVQETVDNSPAGVLPPILSSFSSESTEEGIKLTYKANKVLRYNNPNADDAVNYPLSITKSIMFRYSETNFPRNEKDGILALIDDDLFTVSDVGTETAKEKTNTIVGLTNNKTYYISAFPMSTNNVYNTCSGTNNVNRSKCQWTGTKGTLTINVKQEYNYYPLGEYNVTLTPTAGGDPVIKTQSGAATIVFSGLEAGEYTLSFSTPQYFTAPQSQSVTVVAGQSQNKDVLYKFNPPLLKDSTWEEIEKICESGSVQDFFSIGDEKEIQLTGGEKLTLEIVGFNHDDLSDGSGKSPITFGLKYLMKDFKPMNDPATTKGGFTGSQMYSYLVGTVLESFPVELKDIVKSVNKKTLDVSTGSSLKNEAMKIFLFSSVEVGSQTAEAISGEGFQYDKFTTTPSRKKSVSTQSTTYKPWYLRSPVVGSSNEFLGVNDEGTVLSGDGSFNWYYCNSNLGVCFGFCI